MNKIDEKLRMLQPVLGTIKVEKLRMMYLFEDGFREKKEVENQIDLLIARHVKTKIEEEIILPPPVNEDLSGVLNIGKMKYANGLKNFGDFFLKGSDMIRHIGVFGSTGSGKTTVIYNFLKQLIIQDKPFLVLDWKRDYRDLCSLPEFKNKLAIFTVGRKISPFCFNPKIKPPGVDAHVWDKHLMDIINHAYLLGPGAEDVIRENMQFGTFKEMQENLLKQRKRGREMLWWASAKRTLNAINFPGLAEVVNFGTFDISGLLDKQVVLELDGLSESDKVFLIGSLLMWIYYYRMSQPEREKWKHTVILEEAHHLLLKKSSNQGENFADTLMREVRVFGQAMIIIDQRPSKISDSALANICTKVCLNLNHNQDISAISKALLLPKEKEKYLGMLKVGDGIIKNHRFIYPFLTQLPNFEIRKGSTSDDELRSTMQNLTCSRTHGEFDNSQGSRSSQRIETTPPITAKSAIDALEKCLLTDIVEHPFDGVDMRSKRLGFHPSQMSDIHYSLTKKGVIRPANVGHRKMFEFTPEGRHIADKAGIKIPKQKARGGIEHSFGVYQTVQHLKKHGFKPVCEVQDIDIVDKSSEIAVEIETGKSSIVSNLLKLDQSGFKRRFMLATNKIAEMKIRNRAPDVPDIIMMPIKEFLNLSKEDILTPSLISYSPTKSEVLRTTK